MKARAAAPRRAVLLWGTAWAVAALVCALGAWSYADTRGDGTLSYAKARDAVRADGQRDITRLNSVDNAHLGRDLTAWLDATTGPLHDRLNRTHTADTATLKQSGTSARATVTDAAVTELDTRAGTAKLIATVRIRLLPRGGAATTERKRFEAGLSRTPDGWKLTALTAVPVGASQEAVQ
jgi:Mce-associated membrane protein